jgi:hypothetical protein
MGFYDNSSELFGSIMIETFLISLMSISCRRQNQKLVQNLGKGLHGRKAFTNFSVLLI